MTSIDFILDRLEEAGLTDIEFILDGSDEKAIQATHEIRRNITQYRKTTINSRFVTYTTKLKGYGKTIDEAYQDLVNSATYEEQTLDVYKKGQR